MKPLKLKIMQNTIRCQSLLLKQRDMELELIAIDERLTDQEGATELTIDEKLETSEEALSEEFNREMRELKESIKDEVQKQVAVQMKLLRLQCVNLLEVKLKVIADDVSAALTKLEAK